MLGEIRVYVGPVDNAGRLDELGLNEPLLVEAIQWGSRFALDCTAHDPPSAPGYLRYVKITRGLRDRLVPQGWLADNARNFATVIHPTRSHALVVAAGDAFTGLADQNPSTRSEKGPATKDAVSVNQGTFAAINEDFRRLMAPSGMQTWFVLHFIDEMKHEIRAEVSLPAAMTGDGHVALWRERVILGAIPLDHPTVTTAVIQTPELDIPVERRAQ